MRFGENLVAHSAGLLCYILTLSRPFLRLFSLFLLARARDLLVPFLFVMCRLLRRWMWLTLTFSQKGRADCPYRESIRVLELDARDAQGPCWGRHFQVNDRLTVLVKFDGRSISTLSGRDPLLWLGARAP